ncbi:MAG: transcriptional regulator, partial [Anaerolineaceae bacterium]|nr:transcriptional regulator [Anaerolineaceae bacterium]
MKETAINRSSLHIQLLGEFSVQVGGEQIPRDVWHSRRARSLVKLLALAPGHRLQREQVIDALWPESGLQAGANNFHQTLFGARRVFERAGAACLTLAEGVLSLDCAADGSLRVDVDEFEAAALRAHSEQTPAAYAAALALYPGDLLPEDLYEEWSIPRRASLHQTWLDLLLGLARASEAREDYPPAVEALKKLL